MKTAKLSREAFHGNAQERSGDLLDDYFKTYTNVKSLRSTPETNKILYLNYTSIKKKKDQGCCEFAQ